MIPKSKISNIAKKLITSIEVYDSLEDTFTSLVTYLKKHHHFFSHLDYEDLLSLLFYIYFINKGLSDEQIDGIISGLRVVVIAENTGEQSQTDCSMCGGEAQFECDTCGGGGDRQCDWCGGTGEIKCDDCDGSGEVGDEPCSTCQGSGEVECPDCQGTGEYECEDCSGYGNIDCDNCDSDGKVDYDDHLNAIIWFFLVSDTVVESKNLEPYTQISIEDLDSMMKKSYSFTSVDEIPLQIYTAVDLRNFPQGVNVVLDVLELPSEIFNLMFIKKLPTWYRPQLTRINLKHDYSSGDEELGDYLSKMI